MTVCGLAAIDNRAVGWADRAVSRGGAVIGHVTKLIVGTRARVIATGAGSNRLLLRADGLVREAPSLPALLEQLPQEMQRGASRYGRALFGLAGICWGQPLIFVFRPPRYQPEPASVFTAPEVQMPRPRTALDALDIALAQRRLDGVIAGGALDVAELGPGGIATRALFDLDRMAFLNGAHAGPMRG